MECPVDMGVEGRDSVDENARAPDTETISTLVHGGWSNSLTSSVGIISSGVLRASPVADQESTAIHARAPPGCHPAGVCDRFPKVRRSRLKVSRKRADSVQCGKPPFQRKRPGRSDMESKAGSP